MGEVQGASGAAGHIDATGVQVDGLRDAVGLDTRQIGVAATTRQGQRTAAADGDGLRFGQTGGHATLADLRQVFCVGGTSGDADRRCVDDLGADFCADQCPVSLVRHTAGGPAGQTDRGCVGG